MAALGWPAVEAKSCSLMRKSMHAGRNPAMDDLPGYWLKTENSGGGEFQ
eukprot:SAG11_NODE_31776_length_289_cov_0.815789_1_plen_48_part_10